jgi:HlyD family secretion protein
LKKKKIVIFSIIAVLLCAGGTYFYISKSKSAQKNAASVQETTITVKKGNLRSTISGTAQLEPEQQQMIVPPKEGMIKTINLTRNQPVKKGDLLLELSDSSLDERLDQAKTTLNQYQSDLNDLLEQQASLRTVAPTSGKLMLANNISEGASVSKTTKIASIADTSTLTVTLPFLQEDAAQMHAGDTVELAIDGFMLTKAGTIESVSSSSHSDAKGNRLTDVTVRVDNDGTMDSGLNVRGTIQLNGQKVESTSQAQLQYKKVSTILANTSGTISHMEIKSDQMVKAGQLICTIENDTLQRDISQKQMQIDQQKKSIEDLEAQKENLKVYAPFDGVFSTDFADPKKNVLNSYPVGTTIKSDVQLGAVASLDKLQLPIKVDELDLPKIKTGMKAEVKVDAIPGKVFPAEVSQVSTVGTVTNGVSFYTVVLSLQNTSELKYGMTANADIIVEDKKDVLMIPVEAMQTRGGKRTVVLKKADGTIEENHEIKIGANNSTMVEVTEGLKEGDQVVIRQRASRNNLSQQEIERMRQQFQQGARGAGGSSGNQRSGGAGGGFSPGGFGR